MKKNKLPLTITGGTNNHQSMSDVVKKCGLMWTVAGSLFVLKDSYYVVLINYPEPKIKERLIYGK